MSHQTSMASFILKDPPSMPISESPQHYSASHSSIYGTLILGAQYPTERGTHFNASLNSQAAHTTPSRNLSVPQSQNKCSILTNYFWTFWSKWNIYLKSLINTN